MFIHLGTCRYHHSIYILVCRPLVTEITNGVLQKFSHEMPINPIFINHYFGCLYLLVLLVKEVLNIHFFYECRNYAIDYSQWYAEMGKEKKSRGSLLSYILFITIFVFFCFN